jgi:hypothetical protein
MTDIIRLLATSKSGSEHIVTGYVKDRQTVHFASIKDAKSRVRQIGWENVRYCVDREWDEKKEGWVCLWDDQRKTFNKEGSGTVIYIDK